MFSVIASLISFADLSPSLLPDRSNFISESLCFTESNSAAAPFGPMLLLDSIFNTRAVYSINFVIFSSGFGQDCQVSSSMNSCKKNGMMHSLGMYDDKHVGCTKLFTDRFEGWNLL